MYFFSVKLEILTIFFQSSAQKKKKQQQQQKRKKKVLKICQKPFSELKGIFC